MIVVEGETDVETYHHLLTQFGVDAKRFMIYKAEGCEKVCDMSQWNIISVDGATLFDTLVIDLGRKNFNKILLIVDSDFAPNDAFNKYNRVVSNDIKYDGLIKRHNMGYYYTIDTLFGWGANKVNIYGITVPNSIEGCLETELLNTYKYPSRENAIDDYNGLAVTIKKTSTKWKIKNDDNGKDWYDNINQVARMDKFIYTALYNGFRSVRKDPQVPTEPDVIKHIKEVLDLP
jgi:hypothetical protein